MKIKCRLCGTTNYFSGIEEGIKFCSNCNASLIEPKIPDTTENPYIITEKEKPDTNFSESKKILDIKTFCDKLTAWVVTMLELGREKDIFKNFLEDIKEFGAGKITEDRFFEEIVYYYMWLVYINCVDICQNKTNYYFSYFAEKMHGVIFNMGFSRYGKEKWIKNLMEKINQYTYAYNLSVDNKNFSFLGKVFYKNLYGKEELGLLKIYVFTTFVTEELEISFKSIGKVLTRYKI